jgi:hypothetical protein
MARAGIWFLHVARCAEGYIINAARIARRFSRRQSKFARALPSRLSRDGLQPLCAFHDADFLDAPSEDARLAVSVLAGWAGREAFLFRTN